MGRQAGLGTQIVPERGGGRGLRQRAERQRPDTGELESGHLGNDGRAAAQDSPCQHPRRLRHAPCRVPHAGQRLRHDRPQSGSALPCAERGPEAMGLPAGRAEGGNPRQEAGRRRLRLGGSEDHRGAAERGPHPRLLPQACAHLLRALRHRARHPERLRALRADGQAEHHQAERGLRQARRRLHPLHADVHVRPAGERGTGTRRTELRAVREGDEKDQILRGFAR